MKKTEEGKYRYIFSIAEFPIKIFSDINAVSKIMNDRKHKSFLSKSKPLFRLMVSKVKNKNMRLKPDKELFNLADIKYDKGYILYQNSYFNGKIDFSSKIARLELKDENKIGESIDIFLKILYSNILLNNNGIVMHSSNLIINKKGYCFFGGSGSGKTTISTSAINKSTILSDDVTIIRKIRGKYRIFGSCFWGNLGFRIDPTNSSAELRSMYNIIKHKSNILRTINKKYSMLRLLTTASFLPADKRTYKKVLERLDDITDNFPVYELYFKKDCSFWSKIR